MHAWRVAITQQLARLTSATLDECRSSLVATEKLCSFELLAGPDYLDLDWAPHPLTRAAALSDCPEELSKAIERACAGDAELHSDFRDMPNTIWEHPLNYIEPDGVRGVASVLPTPLDSTSSAGCHAASIPRTKSRASATSPSSRSRI